MLDMQANYVLGARIQLVRQTQTCANLHSNLETDCHHYTH